MIITKEIKTMLSRALIFYRNSLTKSLEFRKEVIEISEFGTRFISFNQTKKMLGFFIGGAILGAWLLRRKKK